MFRLTRFLLAATAALTAACVSRHSAPSATTESPQPTVGCVPAAQRAGAEFGCFVLTHEPIGQLGPAPVFWYVDRYASRGSAESARRPRSTVVEALGGVWRLTIDSAGLSSLGGERVGRIGPLPVSAHLDYTAQYMEAVFRPGMKTRVHRHPGPEAWYTVSGETCLETPNGTMVGRAGGSPVIVPAGPPMELTATGMETRRALVLILHDAAQPMTLPASDWVATGACARGSAR